MKKRNNTCAYIKARNANLIREYFRIIQRNTQGVYELFDQLSRCRADKFYISEERAYLLLKEKIRTGRWPADMVPNRRRMMTDIERRVADMRRARPFVDLKDAVYEVVNSPAPSFYLTPNSVRTILYSGLAAR